MNPLKLAFLTATSTLSLMHCNAFAQTAAASDQWHYSIGAGVMNAPQYPGASDSRTRGFPLLGATYGRFFFGAADVGMSVPVGIGYNFIQNKNWKAGIGIGYDIYNVRKESDNEEKLRGLGDIERTTRTSLFTRYSNKGFSVFGAVINSAKGQGIQVKGGVDFSSQLSPSFVVNAGPSFTWANAKSNKTFFGVNATQSANSGKRQYSPSAGLTDLSLSAGVTYLMTPSWSLGAKVSASYLPDTAADSPIVDKDLTTSYAIYTAYRF
jgi:outer membrane protein